jgi:TolB-like protein
MSSSDLPSDKEDIAAAVLERCREGLSTRYEIFELLGEGANAFVFRARERDPARDIALKILKPELSHTTARLRFQQEIARIGALLHPCILPVLDSGEVAGTPYFVMPLARGESLRARLTSTGPLPLNEVIRIGTDLCDALAYAHSRGIVHRDLKPDNILLAGPRALLADFGQAAMGERDPRDPRLTSEGVVIGTPAYLSPEQAAGAADVGPRSDLYSLGCVLFEMLTGQPPFTAASAQALFAKHISAPVPSLKHDRPGVPAELDQLVRRLLAKSPADRPGSADEVRRDLTNLVERAHARSQSSRPNLGLVLGVAGAATVAALAWLALSRRFTPQPPSATEPQVTQIAVAPFEDLTPESSYGWLVQGLSVELIEALTSVAALDVRSFEAVRAARRSGVTLDSLRRALRVGTMVSGVLERLDTRLRLRVQLTDLNSSNAIGRVIQIEADSGRADSLRFGMLGSVAAELRRALGNRVAELQEPTRRSKNAGWEQHRRAEALRTHATDEIAAGRGRGALGAIETSDSIYGVAIAADPAWNAPTIGRGWLYEYRARFISDTSGNLCTTDCIRWRRRALELAQHVVETYRDTLDALELRGTVRLQLSRSPPLRDSAERLIAAAERDLVTVASADPQRARVWTTLSTLWSRRGEPQRAIDALARAAVADPWLVMEPEVLERSLTDYRAIGMLDEAERRCEYGLVRYPNRVNFQQCRLIILGERGQGRADIDRAWHELRRTTSAIADSTADVTWWFRRVMVAAVLARTGLRDSAYAVLRQSRAQRPTSDPNLLYQEAIVYSVARDTVRAVDALREYLEQRPTGAALVARERRFEAIRGSPLFEAMLR